MVSLPKIVGHCLAETIGTLLVTGWGSDAHMQSLREEQLTQHVASLAHENTQLDSAKWKNE